MKPLRLAVRNRLALPGLLLSAVLIGTGPAAVRAQEATATPTTTATLVPTATDTPTLTATPTAGTDNCRGAEREPNDQVPSCLVAVGGSVAGQIDRRAVLALENKSPGCEGRWAKDIIAETLDRVGFHQRR